jgi:hypothetical protein
MIQKGWSEHFSGQTWLKIALHLEIYFFCPRFYMMYLQVQILMRDDCCHHRHQNAEVRVGDTNVDGTAHEQLYNSLGWINSLKKNIVLSCCIVKHQMHSVSLLDRP